MASELFENGNEEFINENYEEAVKLYTAALELEKNRDDILCNRAQAFMKLDRFKEAVEDSSDAVNLNPKNVKAYLRKGTALFHLEDFASAKEAFQSGLALSENDNNLKTWIRKCDAEMDLNKTEDATVGVAKTQASAQTEDKPAAPSGSSGSSGEPAPDSTSKPQQTTVKPVVTEPPKPPPQKKYDWYQTQTHVVVTVLYKNCQQEDVNINIEKKALTVDVSLPGGSNFFLELRPLAHEIDADKSISKVLKSKIEIKLKKLEGVMWRQLEGEEELVPQVVDSAVSAYPSSSHYTRNWDKLAKEVDEEEKTENKEGDAALNDLFKKIYSDGTDETKKAMMKSFYESGGTVLSTNWNDIKKEKTPVKPPDGMEWKNWEQ